MYRSGFLWIQIDGQELARFLQFIGFRRFSKIISYNLEVTGTSEIGQNENASLGSFPDLAVLVFHLLLNQT